MKNKVWTLPLLFLLAGAALQAFNRYGWALMGEDVGFKTYFLATMAVSAALLVIVAVAALKLCDRRSMLMGAGIMVVYNMLTWGLETGIVMAGGTDALFFLGMPGVVLATLHYSLGALLPYSGAVQGALSLLFLFCPLFLIPLTKKGEGKPPRYGKVKVGDKVHEATLTHSHRAPSADGRTQDWHDRDPWDDFPGHHHEKPKWEQ